MNKQVCVLFKAHLIQSIATHSHRGSVRTVTTNGRLLASGSADETINIYDMSLRKESNMLMEHNGSYLVYVCALLYSILEAGETSLFFLLHMV